MLHPLFQASEASDSEEEDFLKIFSTYFYDLNLGLSVWRGHFGPQGYHLNKFGRCQLDNATY